MLQVVALWSKSRCACTEPCQAPLFSFKSSPENPLGPFSICSLQGKIRSCAQQARFSAPLLHHCPKVRCVKHLAQAAAGTTLCMTKGRGYSGKESSNTHAAAGSSHRTQEDRHPVSSLFQHAGKHLVLDAVLQKESLSNLWRMHREHRWQLLLLRERWAPSSQGRMFQHSPLSSIQPPGQVHLYFKVIIKLIQQRCAPCGACASQKTGPCFPKLRSAILMVSTIYQITYRHAEAIFPIKLLLTFKLHQQARDNAVIKVLIWKCRLSSTKTSKWNWCAPGLPIIPVKPSTTKPQTCQNSTSTTTTSSGYRSG